MAAEELIIDLSNYKDRVGSRVAEGRYTVIVDDTELTESSQKNPMVNLWFRIVGGEYDNQTITDRLVLTEKSMFRVVGFMNAINLPTPRKKLRLNLRQFQNKTLEIEVADGEPYNGRIRSEVRAYYKVPGANQASSQGEDEFDAMDVPPADPNTSDDATDLPDPAPAQPEEANTALGNPEPAESAPQLEKKPQAAPAPAAADDIDLGDIEI